MDKKKGNSSSSDGKMPGNVLAVLDERVHTFTEKPFKLRIHDEKPCDGLDCPFRRPNVRRPRMPQPGDEDKCDRCKGSGKVKASMVIAHTVKNEECLDKGIIPGSQLLSVNGTRVTTMMDAARLITKAELPIKMTFLCLKDTPYRYTKHGREKLRLLYKQFEAGKALLKQMEVQRKKEELEESMKPEPEYCQTCCARRINDAAKCPRCPRERDTQWVPLDDVGLWRPSARSGQDQPPSESVQKSKREFDNSSYWKPDLPFTPDEEHLEPKKTEKRR